MKPIRKVEGKGNEVFIGIAADKKDRAFREDYQNDNIYRLPLIDWGMTEDNCIKFLKDGKLHNPLYDVFKRLGCWLYPKQSIGSLKSLYSDYPELWERLKDYEKDSPTGFKINNSLLEFEKGFKTEIWLEESQLCLF